MAARVCIWAVALVLAGCVAAAAQESAGPVLHTNETEIGEALAHSTLAIDDPLAVFSFVLKRLPDRVRVLPTENYYYVRFTHRGVRYVGNVRLAAADRDQGKVHFSYSEEPADWNGEPADRHGAFGAEQGVSVEKVEPLVYRVARDGRTVTFALNDLSGVKPPALLVKADESYLGPVFDESGIRFFLLFNTRLGIFHFVLDETAGVADQLTAARSARGILIGKRTGFAFYAAGGRKFLVGASERQSRLNTYFDGPFDQIPENFIEGEALRDAIVGSEPRVKGRIDRLGYFSDGTGRFLIHPYMLYRQESELSIFDRCMTSRAVAEGNRPLCFVIDDLEAQRRNPRPRALMRR